MAQIIPEWVKEALNEKLARGDIGFASCGVYTVYVTTNVGADAWMQTSYLLGTGGRVRPMTVSISAIFHGNVSM